MTTLTITVNGKQQGEIIFFTLNVLKSNFLNVVEMTWDTVQDVIRGEEEGHYTIQK